MSDLNFHRDFSDKLPKTSIWQHLERGTKYSVGSIVTLVDDSSKLTYQNGETIEGYRSYTLQCQTPVKRGDELVTYFSIEIGNDLGKGWIRPTAEFLDGRFIRLAVDDE